jgi:hypothetical protein
MKPMSNDVQIEGKYDAFIKEMLDRLCPYYWNGGCKMRLKCGMNTMHGMPAAIRS